MGNLGGWEIIIILGVLVLLFGAKKLPDMARSVGQSARVFKGEMKGLRDEGKTAEEKKAEPAPLPPVQAQSVQTQPVAEEQPVSNPHPTQGTGQ